MIRGSNLDFHQVLDRLLNQLVRTLQAILTRPHRRLKTVQHIRAVDRAQGRDPDADCSHDSFATILDA